MNDDVNKEIALFIVEATAHIMQLHATVHELATVNDEHIRALQAVLLRIKALENENAKMKREFEQLSLLN